MNIDVFIYEAAICASMIVYNILGPGLLESVCEKAMSRELALRKLDMVTQCMSRLSVLYVLCVKIRGDTRRLFSVLFLKSL